MSEPELTTISWHTFDLMSGRRGGQLHTAAMGTVGRLIGEPTDLSGLAVHCWDEDDQAPVPGWDNATLPGRTMLVALDERDQPVWGGMVLRRRSDSTAWVQLDLTTLEAYFDRRYVKDHTFTATAQGAIIEGILIDDVIETGVQFTVDASSGFLRDQSYFDDEDKTALSVLQDLMGIEKGPEFTVDLAWADDTHTTLERIVRVRDRIGTAATTPTTRFEFPGNVADFAYVEDFSGDNGANDVMAVSSGEGDIRPESLHAVATDQLDNGWVRFEHRFTPSTSIVDLAVLDAHARAELTDVRDGLAELTLQVALDSGPRINQDFYLGDDVTAVLTCPRFPARIGPDGSPVPGYTKTVRCTGWEIDYDQRRLNPRLKEVG